MNYKLTTRAAMKPPLKFENEWKSARLLKNLLTQLFLGFALGLATEVTFGWSISMAFSLISEGSITANLALWTTSGTMTADKLSAISSRNVSKTETEAILSCSGSGAEDFLGADIFGEAVLTAVLALRVGTDTDPVERKQATDWNIVKISWNCTTFFFKKIN